MTKRTHQFVSDTPTGTRLAQSPSGATLDDERWDKWRREKTRHTRRLQKLRSEGHRVTMPCLWLDCFRPASDNLPLCHSHARLVHDKIADDLTEQNRRDDENLQHYLAEVAAARKTLNSGKDLPPGARIPGWIYYIKIDGLIKIGYAKDVYQRTRSYPPNAELLAVEPGTPEVERGRHNQFNEHLAWGREWFTPNQELDDWIERRHRKYGTIGHQYKFTEARKKRGMPTPG